MALDMVAHIGYHSVIDRLVKGDHQMATTYAVIVQHNTEDAQPAQEVDRFTRKYLAERFIMQTLEIAKGYNKTFYKDGESWKVINTGGNDDRTISTFWIRRVNG